MKILITIGHGTIEGGGYNPGAVANGYEEFKIAREIGKFTQQHLNNNYDVQCDLWNYNGDLNLTQRINMLQDNKYTYVAEMHLNAGGGTGTEVYSYRTNDIGGRVAGEICKELSNAFSWRNRGVKLSNGNYGIVDRTVPVSNLVEVCFIDKLEDVKKVATSKGQLKAGQMIGEGIAKGLGLKKKLNKPFIPTNTEKPKPNFITPTKKKYSIGDKVRFSTCYKSSTDTSDKAIQARNMLRDTGIITKIVSARNPYLLDDGLCWVNNGDIRELISENNQSSATNKSQHLKGTVLVNNLRMRKSPINGDVIRTFNKGDYFTVLSAKDGWFYIDFAGTRGYVAVDDNYVKVEDLNNNNKIIRYGTPITK